jgi:hypothetical protein
MYVISVICVSVKRGEVRLRDWPVELHEFQLELAASTYTSSSLKRESKNLQ